MPDPASARRRILVIANETAASAAVADEVRFRGRGGAVDVLVVAPLTPPLRAERSLVPGPEERLEETKVRLRALLGALAEAGVDARGELGDADPVRAFDHVAGRYRPDEIIIATHPEQRSQWLAQNIVERVRERSGLPTTHIVADLEQERWEGEGGAVGNNP